MRVRSGSALLIVLGMLAFMVISGVAFSVYMRSTRLNSSFTRRISSSRQLAKAALAEAIDQIDRSIGNDPHPNVRQFSGNDCNYWLGRVLITPYAYLEDNGDEKVEKPADIASAIRNSLTQSLKKKGDTTDRNAVYQSTVPVLTLESLAYIPPPLVNEARVYGQRTPSACWQTFDFDAGRYAFIALDVSDYFDVNRLVADEPRSSNPARRVTYGYAFDTADHAQWEGGADQWDAFMETFRQSQDDGTFSFGSQPPLVSIADFNLAFGPHAINDLKSPFYEAFKPGGKGCNNFYQADPTTEDGPFWKYAGMTFVTDSLDAPRLASELTTEAGETVKDLDDDASQIFTEAFLAASQENRTLYAVSQTSSEMFTRLGQRRVPRMTMFNLSDYLDRDRIPISLGIPSVERVPMVCGIKPNLTSPINLVLTRVDDPDQDVSGTRNQTDMVVKRTVHWRIDPASLNSFLGGVNVLVAYPFRNHEKEAERGFFTLDGKIQLYLSTQTAKLRTFNANDNLHWGSCSMDNAGALGAPDLVAQAVLNFPLNEVAISFDGVTTPEDCVKEYPLLMNLTQCATMIQTKLAGNNGDILRMTFQWTQHLIPATTPGASPTYDNLFTGQIPLLTTANANVSILNSGADAPAASWMPLDEQGNVDSSFLSGVAANPAQNINVNLNMATTIRVKSSDAKVRGGANGTKTVDLVPASLADDKPLNNIDTLAGPGAMFQMLLRNFPTPLMLFKTSFVVNPQSTGSGAQPATVSPQAVVVEDPRYNHAPENWKTTTAFSANDWYADAKSLFASRDGDFFMATSDQDYMQSVYEFAFLPRFSDLENYADGARGNLPGYGQNIAGSWDFLGQYAPVDQGQMWTTYAITRGGRSYGPDDFEGLGLENLSRGLRVNPYSDSTNVIMAAFANTPLDWRAASDDATLNSAAGKSIKDFNENYAWNEYSKTSGKLSWPALTAVAGEFMADVRAKALSGSGDWRDALADAFEQKRANDTESYLCGLDLTLADFKSESGANAPIYSVDKKFLYGFWRNCFAARQQLFLVFFRAEPLMMGGGVGGETPPQLGARGVALVWRNPNKTSGSNFGYQSITDQTSSRRNSNYSERLIETGYRPHQTRVLFYRQFE